MLASDVLSTMRPPFSPSATITTASFVSSAMSLSLRSMTWPFRVEPSASVMLGKHPVNPSCQLGGAGRPAMREQFGDVGRLVGRQSREDVFQIGVGIVPVELGRLDQAHDGSRALTGAQ